MEYWQKTLNILLCTTVTAVALIYWFTSAFFPYWIIGLGVIAILCISLSFVDSSRYRWQTLVSVIGSGISFRLLMYFHPNTFIGRDSASYALETLRIVRTGTIAHFNMGFYREVPGFFIWNAVVIDITGLQIRSALAVFPVILTVGVVLGGYLISRYLSPTKGVLVGSISASLLIVDPMTTSLSVLPWPQTFQLSILMITIYVFLRLVKQSQMRISLLSIIFLASMLYIYKMPLPLLAGGFIFLGIFSHLAPNSWQISTRSNTKRIISIGMLISIILIIQQVFLSDLFGVYTARLLSISPTSQTPAFSPQDSEVAFSILRLLTEWNIRLIFAVSGIAWVYLAITERHRSDITLFLSIVSITTAVSLVGLVTPSYPSFPRLANELMPLLIVLVVMAMIGQRDSFSRKTVFTSSTIFIALLIVSSGMAIDDPRTHQFYLTEDESTAKQFGHQYGETVYTDDILARQDLPNRIWEDAVPEKPSRGIETDDTYQVATPGWEGLILKRHVGTFFGQSEYQVLSAVSVESCSRVYHVGQPAIYTSCRLNGIS